MNKTLNPVALGLDFGTESVRAILIDSAGEHLGSGTHNYKHGQITDYLPTSGQKLPEHYALQSPADWLESAAVAVQAALASSSTPAERIVGIGVDFTSCTMLPTLLDATPLCQLDQFANTPLAWPKLWKHHGAISQTARMNAVAKQRNESFLNRYGGVIGLEWFFPKLLETIEMAPEVADAAQVWLEAGDWLVWQLTGVEAREMSRSTCQAGYKALWSPQEGYANQSYLSAVHPKLAQIAAHCLPGHLRSPGQPAGGLCERMAKMLGLRPGIAVSTAIIDAHAAVPGVGVAQSGALVMVLGTSSCHMLNSNQNQPISGIAGLVDGGILPGLFGYETGQAAVGDAFAWLINLLKEPDFDQISQQAMHLPPGSDGVMCMDWMNGCRTPLMDGSLRGAFVGLTLGTTSAQMYRALLEGSAFGLRWIVELLRDGGVPVDRLVATGGLPHHNPALIQIYANVLGCEIEVHPSRSACAVGAAVLGMIAAGQNLSGFSDITSAAQAMAAAPPDQLLVVRYDKSQAKAYDVLYHRYRQLAEALQALDR